MNTKKARVLFCLFLTVLMLLVTACSKGEEGDGKDGGSDEVLLPISINGKEIRVG